jgi:hypothetical protein
VVRGVFGSAVVVGVGRCSERGLPGRYVHLRRHFLVGISSGMVRPAVRLPILGAYGRVVRWLVLYWSWSRSRGVLSLGCDVA